MKRIVFGGLLLLSFTACVPAKKYNELVEKEKVCGEELAKFKSEALNNEAKAKNFQTKYEVIQEELTQLKSDTTELGNKYRNLRAKYDHIVQVNEALETNYNKLQLTGAAETARLATDLEAKKIELQRREDELLVLEQELAQKKKC